MNSKLLSCPGIKYLFSSSQTDYSHMQPTQKHTKNYRFDVSVLGKVHKRSLKWSFCQLPREPELKAFHTEKVVKLSSKCNTHMYPFTFILMIKSGSIIWLPLTQFVPMPRLFALDTSWCKTPCLHFKQMTLSPLTKEANLSERFLPSLLSSHRRKITKLLIDG